MTLKEIEKIIDESVVVQEEKSDRKNKIWLIEGVPEKEGFKSNVEQLLEKGSVLHFYTIFKVSGVLGYYAKIDHIDKKTKVIKKKLDEMTNEEIKQVMDRICDPEDSNDCDDCPFDYGKKCLASFPFWKKLYEDNKDKEFDVEVEE